MVIPLSLLDTKLMILLSLVSLTLIMNRIHNKIVLRCYAMKLYGEKTERNRYFILKLKECRLWDQVSSKLGGHIFKFGLSPTFKVTNRIYHFFHMSLLMEFYSILYKFLNTNSIQKPFYLRRKKITLVDYFKQIMETLCGRDTV